MVKNVPCVYTWKALLADISEHCDLQCCDMLHLPVGIHQFHTRVGRPAVSDRTVWSVVELGAEEEDLCDT